MNDDFLHRLRERPRPEFLASLKARLDRQPRRAIRRPGFTLGLLVGLLAAGAAFAVYLNVYRHPTAAAADQPSIKATPLAPAWMPTHPHVGPIEPAPSTDSAVESPQEQSAASAATSTLQTFSFLANQQSMVAQLLSEASIRNVRLKNPHYSIRDSLQHLCDGTGAYDFPDMVQLNRRLTVEEYRTCTSNGPSPIVEQKLGYQAVSLARSKLNGPLRLTARDLFLALAQRVPDPDRPGQLMDNHYAYWNQVDPTLPPDRIKFLGPALESAPGRLPAELLLTAGCNTYAWIAALRLTDEVRYTEICQSLRSDGVYQASYSYTVGQFAGILAVEPNAIGIFLGIPEIGENLVVNPVDGIAPSMTTLASGTYPLARPLYLYMDKNRLKANPFIDKLVLSMLDPSSIDKRSATFWAFVPSLDSAGWEALGKDRDRFKELHF